MFALLWRCARDESEVVKTVTLETLGAALNAVHHISTHPLNVMDKLLETIETDLATGCVDKEKLGKFVMSPFIDVACSANVSSYEQKQIFELLINLLTKCVANKQRLTPEKEIVRFLATTAAIESDEDIIFFEFRYESIQDFQADRLADGVNLAMTLRNPIILAARNGSQAEHPRQTQTFIVRVISETSPAITKSFLCDMLKGRGVTETRSKSSVATMNRCEPFHSAAAVASSISEIFPYLSDESPEIPERPIDQLPLASPGAILTAAVEQQSPSGQKRAQKGLEEVTIPKPVADATANKRDASPGPSRPASKTPTLKVDIQSAIGPALRSTQMEKATTRFPPLPQPQQSAVYQEQTAAPLLSDTSSSGSESPTKMPASHSHLSVSSPSPSREVTEINVKTARATTPADSENLSSPATTPSQPNPFLAACTTPIRAASPSFTLAETSKQSKVMKALPLSAGPHVSPQQHAGPNPLASLSRANRTVGALRLNVVPPGNVTPSSGRKRTRDDGEEADPTVRMSIKKRRAIKLLREALAEPTGDSDMDSGDDDIVLVPSTPEYLRTPASSPNRRSTGAGAPESDITGIFTEVGRLYTKALAEKAKHFEEKNVRSVERMNKDVLFIEACVAERSQLMDRLANNVRASTKDFEDGISKILGGPELNQSESGPQPSPPKAKSRRPPVPSATADDSVT
ncbi:hypothetical protein HDU88_005942 [Geranomyces variabilis]|nr:hypothetical protein HDU88_005942 [Geranomyces variabilis]